MKTENGLSNLDKFLQGEDVLVFFFDIKLIFFFFGGGGAQRSQKEWM